MDLDELLTAMDRTMANLAKLDAVWGRAEPMIPTSPSVGTSREYEDLRRSWLSLREGLPPIDGWTVTAELPDANEVGRGYIDYAEIGEIAFDLIEQAERPGIELAEYRFRLGRARRRAVQDRLDQIVGTVSRGLPAVIEGVGRGSTEVLSGAEIDALSEGIKEIDRLVADSVDRGQHWRDLRRHISFSQGQDWHDIAERDWPAVRGDIELLQLTESDPLSVPDVDLGIAASGHPKGGVTTALQWDVLGAEAFERLLFDLLRGLRGYQNVQWLMNPNAPDRGRDLSLDRIIDDAGGATRFERVIVQAKHWSTRSVGPADVKEVLSRLPLWEPPRVAAVIFATTGRFTADAVAVVESHNRDVAVPRIDMWVDSRLEALLAERPDIVESHGLRK